MKKDQNFQKMNQIKMISNSSNIFPGQYLVTRSDQYQQNKQQQSNFTNINSNVYQSNANNNLDSLNLPIKQSQRKYIQSNRNLAQQNLQQSYQQNFNVSQDYSRSLPPKQRTQQNLSKSLNQPVIVTSTFTQDNFQYPSTLRNASINDKIKHLENMNIHYRQMIESIKNSKTESQKLKLLTAQIDQMTKQMVRLQDQLGSSQVSQNLDNSHLNLTIYNQQQTILKLKDQIKNFESKKKDEQNSKDQNLQREFNIQKNKIDSLNFELEQKNKQNEQSQKLQIQYKEQLESLQKDNQNLLKQIFEYQKNQQELQQKIEIQKTEIIQKEKIIETRTVTQDFKSQILKEHENQIKQLTSQIHDIEYKKNQKNYQQLQEQKNTYENLINLNKNLILQKNNEIEQLKQAKQIFQEERLQYQQNLQKQQNEIQNLMNETYTQKLQIQSFNHQKLALSKQIESQQNEVKHLKDVIQQLKKELTFMENYQLKEISKRQSQEFTDLLEKEVHTINDNGMNFKVSNQYKVQGSLNPQRQSLKTNQSDVRNSIQNKVQEFDSVYDKLQKILLESSKEDKISNEQFLQNIKNTKQYKELIKDLKAENYLNQSQLIKNEQDLMDLLRQFPVDKEQLFKLIDDQNCKPKLVVRFILDDVNSRFQELEYQLDYEKNKNKKVHQKLMKDKEELDAKIFELNQTIQNLKVENQSLIMSNSMAESKGVSDMNSQIEILKKENKKLKQELQKLRNHVRGKRQKMLSQLNQLVEDKSNFESSFLSSLSKTPKKKPRNQFNFFYLKHTSKFNCISLRKSLVIFTQNKSSYALFSIINQIILI